MRAIIFDKELKYKDEYPAPHPHHGEALVRVQLAGICATDIEITKGYMDFSGVLGHEFVGMIEECEDWELLGRRVVGEINIGCNKCDVCASGLGKHCPHRKVLGIHGKDGAFADFITLPLANLHTIPGSMSNDQAVFVEPLAAAFDITERVEIGPETDVCILGDGKLGLLAAQVVKLAGARVVLSGHHKENLALAEGWGIETNDCTHCLHRKFDVVVDATGSASGLEEALKITKPRGTVVLKTTVAERAGADLNRAVIDEITIVGSRCGPFKRAIEALDEGKIDVMQLISKRVILEDALEAMEYASQSGVLKVLLRL